ncbi:hypothetical protein BC628DRAFT_746638 [Trametes gibbosa]|nr:hypothetical protein BC628DRAFT_746638 [Trametes gibbosa]
MSSCSAHCVRSGNRRQKWLWWWRTKASGAAPVARARSTAGWPRMAGNIEWLGCGGVRHLGKTGAGVRSSTDGTGWHAPVSVSASQTLLSSPLAELQWPYQPTSPGHSFPRVHTFVLVLAIARCVVEKHNRVTSAHSGNHPVLHAESTSSHKLHRAFMTR